MLDVVYNHLGPEGNVLDAFAPYFTDRYSTPVGPGGQPRRARAPTRCGRTSSQNALSGSSDFHVDGLRLDAVHELIDRTRHAVPGRAVRTVDELGDRSGARAS